MNKDEYIKTVCKNESLDSSGKKILIEQIEKYYEVKDCIIEKDTYNAGEEVKLKKGTLLHGTYKNFDGLKEILVNVNMKCHKNFKVKMSQFLKYE